MGVSDEQLRDAGPWPAGINNVAPEGSLPLNERGVPVALREAVNVDLTADGRVRLRRGSTDAVPGVLSHSLWSRDELDFGLYVDSGQLHRIGTDEVSTPLGVDVGNYPTSYALVGDRILYSNRMHSGMITLPDLELHRWAPELPESTPLIAVVDGYGLVPGQYQVAITQTDALRRESGAGMAQVVQVGEGQGILLSGLSAVANSRTNVYVSGPNDQVLRLHARVSGGTSMHLIATAAEGISLPTSLLDPMPAGQFCRVHNGRHWVADGRTLRWSPPFRYGMTDLAHALMRFDSDIDLLEPCGAGGEGAGLFVAAGKRTYWLGGATPEAFRLVDVHSAGAVPGTSVWVPGKAIGMDDDADRLIWASRKGVYVLGHEGGRVTSITDGRAVTNDAQHGASVFMERDGIRQIVTSMKGPRHAGGLAVTDRAVAHVIHAD